LANHQCHHFAHQARHKRGAEPRNGYEREPVLAADVGDDGQGVVATGQIREIDDDVGVMT
jgi:hypothetical protein